MEKQIWISKGPFGYYICRGEKVGPYGDEYFAGYDFMGGANWENKFSFDYAMDKESAIATLADLKSSEI